MWNFNFIVMFGLSPVVSNSLGSIEIFIVSKAPSFDFYTINCFFISISSCLLFIMRLHVNIRHFGIISPLLFAIAPPTLTLPHTLNPKTIDENFVIWWKK